jgi:hypothetical protein
MSDLWIVLVIVVIWLAALVMLVALCASAKAGDRTRIDWGDLPTPPRAQRPASAARGLRTGLSRQTLARARRIRASRGAGVADSD